MIDEPRRIRSAQHHEFLADRARTLFLVGARAAGVALGGVIGRPDRVGQLFPSLSPLVNRLVACEIESHRAVALALRAAHARWGHAWLVRSVEVRGAAVLDRLRRAGQPVLAVSWHAGVGSGVSAGLARLGCGGIILRFHEKKGVEIPGFSYVTAGEGTPSRTHALMRATRTLRSGGTVLAFVDAPSPQDIDLNPPVRFLDRSVSFFAGTAAMARLGRTLVVPVEARLDAARLVMEVFEPLEPGPSDYITTSRIAAFFESRILRDPGSIWRSSLDFLCAAPRWSSVA